MENNKKLEIQAKKYKGDSLVVSARIPVELVKKIDGVCEATGRTRNDIIISCLDFALDNIVISKNEGE